MRNKQKSKAICQRIHAKNRAKERFNISLNRDQLNGLVKDIQDGKFLLLKRESSRVSIYECILQDKVCAIVYDRKRKNIVSFLRREWINSNIKEIFVEIKSFDSNDFKWEKTLVAKDNEDIMINCALSVFQSQGFETRCVSYD